MTIQEKISEKIKETYLDLLPKEELDLLVKNEIDAFFNEETKSSFRVEYKSGNWNNPNTFEFTSSENMSPFRKMVWLNLINNTAKCLQSDLVKTYFKGQYSVSNEELNIYMKDVIKEFIPLAIQKYFENIAFNMATNMMNSIMNNTRNY